MKYSLITNNCLGADIYNKCNIEYTTPFIGSYFQDDDQYLKFCLNYDHYISCVPEFKKPLLPMDANYPPIPPGSYPVMFLDDIEIHWIHETDQQTLMEKYNRRLKRTTTPFFIWGDALLHRPHTEAQRLELIRMFNTLENRVYFNKDHIIEWKDKSFEKRNIRTTGWARPLLWLKFPFVVGLVIDHLKTLDSISDNN